MIYYILHQSPLWKGVPDGKRNVRILFLTLTLYLFIHSIAYEMKDKNIFAKVIHGYFVYFLLIDVVICATLYKTYYGRSILKELKPNETDAWDEKNHRYYKIETHFSNNYDKVNDKIIDEELSKTELANEEPVLENPVLENPVLENTQTDVIINDNLQDDITKEEPIINLHISDEVKSKLIDDEV